MSTTGVRSVPIRCLNPFKDAVGGLEPPLLSVNFVLGSDVIDRSEGQCRIAVLHGNILRDSQAYKTPQRIIFRGQSVLDHLFRQLDLVRRRLRRDIARLITFSDDGRSRLLFVRRGHRPFRRVGREKGGGQQSKCERADLNEKQELVGH